MIKLACNLSKKVPIPGCDFSSQNYGAALDIEIADSSDVQTIQTRLRQMYRVLEESIDIQIQAAANGNVQGSSSLGNQNTNQLFLDNRSSERSSTEYQSGSRNQNTKGDERKATSAQVKAIHAIIKNRGFGLEYLSRVVFPKYQVDRVEDLSLQQASEIIKGLKESEAQSGRR